MAVTLTSGGASDVVEITTASQSSSQNIAVPSDAELAIVFIAGWDATANWIGDDSCTLGGSGMTTIGRTDSQTSSTQCAAERLASPTTGASVSFAWSFADTFTDGCIMQVCFFKGNDTTTPIRDSGTSTASDPDITGMSNSAGDMMVGGIADWYGSPFPTVTDDSQTELVNSTYNTADIAIGYEANEGDWYCTAVSGGDPTAVACVIQVAAAAGGLSIPIRRYHMMMKRR